MSAPDTELQTQKKRHRPAIYAISAGLAVAAILILFSVFREGIPVDEQAESQLVPPAVLLDAPEGQ